MDKIRLSDRIFAELGGVLGISSGQRLALTESITEGIMMVVGECVASELAAKDAEIAELRQQMFPISQDAMKFQDLLGEWIADAINEKLQRNVLPSPSPKVEGPKCPPLRWEDDFGIHGDYEIPDLVCGVFGFCYSVVQDIGGVWRAKFNVDEELIAGNRDAAKAACTAHWQQLWAKEIGSVPAIAEGPKLKWEHHDSRPYRASVEIVPMSQAIFCGWRFIVWLRDNGQWDAGIDTGWGFGYHATRENGIKACELWLLNEATKYGYHHFAVPPANDGKEDRDAQT